MATLLFVILRAVHIIELPKEQSDMLAALQLLAIDTVSLMIFLHALLTRRAKNR